MPWLRNEHTQFPDELIGVLNNASSTVRHELYRSRNPIDTGLFSYIAMLFRLPMVPADKQNTRNRFKTVAMPRGVEPQQAYDAVGSYLEQMQYTHNYSRAVLFVNTDNNQAVTPFVIEKLKEQGWEAHDYRTALACTPFHQLDVLTITQQGATQMHVVVFTNVLNDEFILKFGGIMPLLYGYEIPEAMTNAFLECDKQAFFAAYAPIMVEILAAQRRAEQEHTLNDLTTYLSRGQQDRLERNIASKQNDITSLENSLRSSYAQLQEFLLQKSSTLWGLADNSIADFIQYIKDYDAKNITHMSFNAGYDSFNIVIVTSLLYWDEEVYKSFRASTRMNCVTEQSDAVKKLLDNIFLDKTVQVIFHTGISIHFNHCTVERNTSILSDGSSQIGIPHTHIYHHNCWGNNMNPIQKAFNKKDYLVGWEQIKATLSGLNVADSTVFEKFCNRYMAGCGTPCLKLVNTGEKLTPSQFVQRFPDGYTPVTAEATPEVVVTETPRRRRRTVTGTVNPEPTEVEAVDDDPFI